MSDESRIAEILADWRLRWESGERPDPEDVIRAHPDLAEELRAHFRVVRSVDRATSDAFEELEAPPRRLGPYRILRELGRGGMGTVYLAETSESERGLEPGRRVALKLLRPGLLARPGFFKRFLREAEAGRKVRHANVVRTLDADALEVDGRSAHFLVMEYVEGRTLGELLLDLGTVPEALVREIAKQLAEGLSAIHAHGIVHRDLKPENALITDDRKVRIMDLGVARLLDDSLSLTREGQFAGSLPYAAPEQFRGAEVGPAADLYALGVVLFELVTGQNPFRRDEPAAVMRAHVEAAPPGADELNPEVSPFFAEVLHTLLAKDPSARFEDAEALLGVLEEGERSDWWAEQARGPRRAAFRLPRVPVRRETKLYGRDSDLDLLRDFWRRARDGEGGSLLVEGEAGIGKSRLVDAFLNELAREDAHVLYGSYPPSGGLGGLSEAILDHFGQADLERALGPRLTATPSLVPAFAALLTHRAVPAGAERISGDALHAVFCHLMCGLAEEKPLLLVVEDLHFAGPEGRGYLLSLARALQGRSALLLLTTRPGIPNEYLTHLGRLDWFRRTALSRLSPRAVVLLLQDAFRSEALAEKLGVRVALKSDGIPFFVFEMVRGLAEGQFITELPDGSYVETREVEQIAVPSAVRDLIEARLRDITKEERALLDVGAVAGYEFDPDLVAWTLGWPRVSVLQDLADLDRRSGVVRSAGPAYRFDHHQIQEVVYEDLPEGLRKEYHTLLARALAAREGADGRAQEEIPGETAHLLAFHYVRGGEPREALLFLDPALDHLGSSYRNDGLLDLADRALGEEGLLTGAQRARVLLRKAGCLDLLGRREDQAACIDEAASQVDEDARPDLQLQVERARWRLHEQTGEYDDARTCCERILKIARRSGDRSAEAEALAKTGRLLALEGRPAEAEDHASRGLRIAEEIGDRAVEARASADLAAVLTVVSRHDEARAHGERALEFAAEMADRRHEADVIGGLAWSYMNLGRFEEANSLCARGLSLSREIGDREGEAVFTRKLGVYFESMARYRDSLAYYERALTLSREIGNRRLEAFCIYDKGILLGWLGAHVEAGEHMGRSGELIREIGLRAEEGWALNAQGFNLWMRGDLEGCQRLFEEGLDHYRATDDRIKESDTHRALGELMAEMGETEAAEGHFQKSLALTEDPLQIVKLLAERAVLPGGSVEPALAAFAEHGAGLEVENRMRARLRFWQATQDAAHLEEAHRLLSFAVEHAPEEYRETMIEHVPWHRGIVAAWEEHRGRS